MNHVLVCVLLGLLFMIFLLAAWAFFVSDEKIFPAVLMIVLLFAEIYIATYWGGVIDPTFAF